ncbi:hypothetical protein GCM10022236_52770 [Microlunatus ginsengisoli]|uniref:Uncharacterized protein n=1 Tax=Microlunatus ginsengisoli TaxID=363863 RepID=A0ABP7AZ20_9ACTN
MLSPSSLGPELVGVELGAGHRRSVGSPELVIRRRLSAAAPVHRRSDEGLLANFAGSSDPAEIGRCYDEETRHRPAELGDLFDPGHVLDVGQVVRQTQSRG